jgi:hypothetical protein
MDLRRKDTGQIEKYCLCTDLLTNLTRMTMMTTLTLIFRWLIWLGDIISESLALVFEKLINDHSNMYSGSTKNTEPGSFIATVFDYTNPDSDNDTNKISNSVDRNVPVRGSSEQGKRSRSKKKGRERQDTRRAVCQDMAPDLIDSDDDDEY